MKDILEDIPPPSTFCKYCSVVFLNLVLLSKSLRPSWFFFSLRVICRLPRCLSGPSMTLWILDSHNFIRILLLGYFLVLIFYCYFSSTEWLSMSRICVSPKGIVLLVCLWCVPCSISSLFCRNVDFAFASCLSLSFSSVILSNHFDDFLNPFLHQRASARVQPLSVFSSETNGITAFCAYCL